MNVRFLAGVALLAVLLLVSPFLPGLVGRFGVSPGSLVEAGEGGPFSFDGCVFCHDGYWIIAADILGDGSLCYFYSPDGLSWLPPVKIESAGSYNNHRGASVWKEPYPSPYVHIVYLGLDGNLYYRRGMVQSGHISWENRTLVASPGVHTDYHYQVCVSEGNVWVLWQSPGAIFIKCLNTGSVFTLPNIVVKPELDDRQMCPLPGGRVAVYGAEAGNIHKVITVSTSGVESVEEIGFLCGTYHLNIVRSGGRLYVAFPYHDDENGCDHIYVYGRFQDGWRKVYHRTLERYLKDPLIETPVSLNATPGGGLVLFYGKDEPGEDQLFEKAMMVRSPDGINWGSEEELLHLSHSVEWLLYLCSSSYCTGDVICTAFLVETTVGTYELWFRKIGVAAPAPPTPLVIPMPLYTTAVGVSSYCYYFASENGCVLLVRATFENGEPLPPGTRILLDGGYLEQAAWDAWYRMYPPGHPAPESVTLAFEIPGMMRVMKDCPVSVRKPMGGLTVFTVDREGKPVPAIVKVEAGGRAWTARSSDGAASFPGLPAGKATVSAIPVESGRYAPPRPVSVDVAPNRVTTVTLVFPPLYDPSRTGRVAITNVGMHMAVVRIDAGEELRVGPGETVYRELPAGKHFVACTGENPLLFEPQYLVFDVVEGETLHLSVSVSPARDEGWLREWTENVRMGRGIGDLVVLVVDKATGLPVTGATVTLDVGLRLTAGMDGWCRFSGVPVGNRTVTALSPGFFPSRARVRVLEGGTASVAVELAGFQYEAGPPSPTGAVAALLLLAALLSGLLLALKW